MDATVSGFMFDTVTDPSTALQEMHRVTKPGGRVAAFVWDDSMKSDRIRYFWDAIESASAWPAQLEKTDQFLLRQPTALSALFETLDFIYIATIPMNVEISLSGFGEYWDDHVLGQWGPAPVYVRSLEEEHRDIISETLSNTLPFAADGSLVVSARCWGVQATLGR